MRTGVAAFTVGVLAGVVAYQMIRARRERQRAEAVIRHLDSVRVNRYLLDEEGRP